MKVSELARIEKVPAHIVRYYARIGLLQPSRDLNNGYQLFSDSDRFRLRLIRQAQSLGLSLSEIREVLEQLSQDCSPEQKMMSLLRHRLEKNRHQIYELVQRQARIEGVLCRCKSTQFPDSNIESWTRFLERFIKSLSESDVVDHASFHEPPSLTDKLKPCGCPQSG